MRILIVAADPREFSGLLARVPAVQRAGVAADWARTARLGEHDLLLVANGAGPRRAATAVEAALSAFRPDAMVSTGFCGAVAPELAPAGIVVATEVADNEARYAAARLGAAVHHRQGVVRTLDHIAQTIEEKRFWRSAGAIAVEMEAAAVAQRAQALGIPFYCIKAVSDVADESLSINFNAALRPDGHFDTISILGSVLRHPLAGVPELFRLRSRSVRAANSLGDFFADCRF